MEREEREKSPEAPPHPPPTYLWEEIRRRKEAGIYPWTHIYKPPYSDEEWGRQHDHEYEPIQAPRSASQPPDSGRSYNIETRSHPVEVITRSPVIKSQSVESRSHPVEVNLKREEEDRYEVVRPQEALSVQETTADLQVEGGYEIVEEPKKQEPKRYIRIPNEDAIIVPLHGSSDEDINPDRYVNPALMMSEEEIERLPQTMSFIETAQEAPKEQTKTHDTIQQRFRTQTDRLTTKLKGISKPNINLHKPKIKLPERPNIKMPEIPKIKLPDRPKFSLPDTSKFHLPERPKFHFPDRPKFHLPEKPKFLTERPKFKLPERPKFTRAEKKPKGPKGKKPNPSSLRRPLRDVVTISSQSTPGSTHNIFETLKFRTYPRFFKKKKAPTVQKMSSLDTESSQPSTPPMRPRSYSGQQQDTSWVHAYRDVKFADEDSNLRVEKMEEEYEKEENTALFHENYDGRVRNMVEREFKQGKAESMTSVASEKGSSGSSSNRRRAGVIEEIDSDEFFVREKGLSREDVDVSRYLSLEIRDAFRQPKNALASLDSELYDDEEPEIKFEHSPRAPQRTKPRKSASIEREQEFHTFPKRPSRRKESDPEIVVKPPRRFRSNSKSGSRYRSRQSSMPSLNSELDLGGAPEPPRRKSRERSIKSLNREGQVSYIDDDNVQNRVSAQHSVEIPPVAPLRKSRSRGTSLADDDRTSRGADSLILPDDDEAHHTHHVEREDVDEEIMIDDEEIKEESIEEEEPYKEVEPLTTKEPLQTAEKVADYSGYAVVSKDKKKPPRPPPPPHQHFHFQSQLDSIKNTGKQIFFTYPRRAIKSLHKQPPARPVRNYSTLGPVRPPRKNRVFRQPLYMTGDNLGQQDSFVDKERDLQSGDIVNRMKGRPLPPPPRPPRKTKDFDNFIESETTDTIPTETIIATTEIEIEKDFEPEIEDRLSYLKAKKDKFFSTLSKYSPLSSAKNEENKREEITQTSGEGQTNTSQQTSFDFGDVSIQTDPLPKGCIIIDQEIEETEEILILPDKTKEYAEYKDDRSISEDVNKRRLSDKQEIKTIESIQRNEESERESPETNIFQHALERVEAARGVLKEARERVIPGSTSSLDDRRPVEEKESLIVRVSQTEALPTSDRSDEVEKEGTPPPLPVRPLYTKPIPVSFPDKLHLSELEVDTLNVSEIQANKIKVSEIESTCIEVTELTSRGGNLTLNGIELPPDFISNIVAQVAAQQSQQQQPQIIPSPQPLIPSRESTPQRQMRRVLTPPPSILVHTTSEQVSLPELKMPETDGTEHLPQPKTTRSKGRKLQTRVIDDSEDELASTLTQRRAQETKKKSEEKSELKSDDSLGPRLTQASSGQLLGRLFSIWQDHVVQGAGTFVQGVNSLFPEGEKRRDAQIAAVILLILITGLILVGFGFDNSVHHHHWDYLPPR